MPGEKNKAQTLSRAIRQKLNEREWSQKKLSQYLEKDESTVSLWISGKSAPRTTDEDEDFLDKLAIWLEMDVKELGSLIEAQRKTYKKPEDRRGKLIRNRNDLGRILEEEYPAARERVTSLNILTWMEGIKERLLEKGYRFAMQDDEFETAITSFFRDNPHSTPISVEGDKAIVLGAQNDQALNVLNQEIPQEKRLEKIRKALFTDPWIRTVIRQICRQIDTEFEASSEQLSLKELKSIIFKNFQEVSLMERENITEALIEVLLRLQMVVDVGGQCIARKCEIEPESVINEFFGINLGVTGLDFLLRGGLLLPTATGMAVLIKGGPGTCKTTLALQMAASIAGSGNVSVYLTAEEDPNLLLERLSFIGYLQHFHKDAFLRTLKKNGKEFQVLMCNYIGENGWQEIFSKLKKPQGIFLIVSIPNRESFLSNQSHMLKNFYDLLGQSGGHDRKITCFVIDSLDALIENGGDRRIYEDVFGFAKRVMRLGLFISETGEVEHSHLRMPVRVPDHQVDMVIRMGYRTVLNFKERVLEIEKCRTQDIIRGEHMFSNSSGKGITVYFSIQSQLSVWRKRIRRQQDLPVESWKIDDDLNLDLILRGDLCKGSANLLSGPPGSHKFPIGLSFLASGLTARPDTVVLLISLREDEAAILKIVSTYPQLNILLDREKESVSLGSKLEVMYFPPDYYTGERLIFWIKEHLKGLKKKGKTVSRVLFNNLAQLSYNSPLYNSPMPKFPDGGNLLTITHAALIELFRKEEITSLFIDVGRNKEAEVQNIFDAILFTSLDENIESDIVYLAVSHTGPCNADRTPKRLERIRENGKGRLILEG